MRASSFRSLAFAGGLAAGVAVTARLHGDPSAGRWGERIGRTRLRYANVPLGGAIALGTSRVLPPGLAAPVRALGVGAVIGAVGWGFIDPLPASSASDPRSPRSGPPDPGARP